MVNENGDRPGREGAAGGLPESLSRDSYFETAMEILAVEGSAALTIAELCQRLGVTKGSFYHHFPGRPGFVAALLDYWQIEHAARLIGVSESIPDPHERMSVLKTIAVGLPHDAEAAIRAWSSQDRHVAAVQRQVDDMRTAHLKDAYQQAGMDPARADLVATIAMSVLAGMQMLVRPSDPEVVRQIFDALETSFLETPNAYSADAPERST